MYGVLSELQSIGELPLGQVGIVPQPLEGLGNGPIRRSYLGLGHAHSLASTRLDNRLWSNDICTNRPRAIDFMLGYFDPYRGISTLNADKLKYREFQEQAPPTSWTRISRARNRHDEHCEASLKKLLDAYDRPLQCLFESLLPGHPEVAHDWKQDFIVSHMMTPKVFEAAKPERRFRTFLAACVHNYVVNQIEKAKAQKRKPVDGALPLSQLAQADDSKGMRGEDMLSAFEKRLTDSETELTRHRAFDLFYEAIDQLELWAANQDNAEELLVTVQQMRDGSITSFRAVQNLKREQKDLIARFKDLLRSGIREEIFLRQSESEELVLGREIAIFYYALDGGE